MSFPKTCLAVSTSDGRHVTLLEPLVYWTDAGEQLIVPIGSTSDGASVPSAAWAVVPPFGRYWLAAVLHDYLYRMTDRPKVFCDAILLEAMAALDVPRIERDAIYRAVVLGGAANFNADRRPAPP